MVRFCCGPFPFPYSHQSLSSGGGHHPRAPPLSILPTPHLRREGLGKVFLPCTPEGLCSLCSVLCLCLSGDLCLLGCFIKGPKRREKNFSPAQDRPGQAHLTAPRQLQRLREIQMEQAAAVSKGPGAHTPLFSLSFLFKKLLRYCNWDIPSTSFQKRKFRKVSQCSSGLRRELCGLRGSSVAWGRVAAGSQGCAVGRWPHPEEAGHARLRNRGGHITLVHFRTPSPAIRPSHTGRECSCRRTNCVPSPTKLMLRT